ncbi:Ceramide synthase 6, partial [Pseudolycoriella hygida]
VVGLVKQVDLTERQIERWWRLRRAQDKPSTLEKFCEASWKCLYYTYSFTYGTIILWDKPWLWDVKSCWYGYPHHSIDNGIWWYFSVSMAFYFSLTVTQFFETRRKDFWQMFAHHIITLAMLVMSWLSNFHRLGTLILVIHDCADIFLESGKSLKYAKYHKICDYVVVTFLVTWVATRLVFYPRVVYGSIFEAEIEMFPLRNVCHILLVALLCLHVFWSYMIFQMAYSSVSAGQVDLTEREIERWWRLRRAQSIDNGVWWYYSVSIASYSSLAVTQFFETRRKDFWQMFAHHIIT